MLTLLKDFVQRQDAILQLTRELVEHESTSRDEKGLNEIAHLVAQKVKFVASRVNLIAAPGFGTHFLANFDFGHPPETPHILVLGHLDTVWPRGTLARKPFTITPEGTALGPGIFDMKSGVAVLLSVLEYLKESKLPTRHRVTVLLTCDEEIGSRSSRQLIEETASGAIATLVLEPPVPGGILKTGRKGVGVATINVTGKAAHAGLDPEKGVNAIVELAHQTVRLSELNDFENGVSVTVGVVSGGTTSNVVPASATAKVDFRFWTLADGNRIENIVRNLQPVLNGAALDVSGGINRPPMERSEDNLALFETARAAAAELGFELKEQTVGGGSDGNFTAALGVPTLDGLGVDGSGAHAEHENIVVSDIPRRAALIAALLQRV